MDGGSEGTETFIYLIMKGWWGGNSIGTSSELKSWTFFHSSGHKRFIVLYPISGCWLDESLAGQFDKWMGWHGIVKYRFVVSKRWFQFPVKSLSNWIRIRTNWNRKMMNEEGGKDCSVEIVLSFVVDWNFHLLIHILHTGTDENLPILTLWDMELDQCPAAMG